MPCTGIYDGVFVTLGIKVTFPVERTHTVRPYEIEIFILLKCSRDVNKTAIILR